MFEDGYRQGLRAGHIEVHHGDDMRGRYSLIAVCVLLAAALLACTGGSEDSGMDERVTEPEAKAQSIKNKKQWSKDKDEWQSLTDDAVLERTARLAEDAGGEVHYVAHPERGDRSVLVTPHPPVIPAKAGTHRTPLIVSLHGFGGNSADHITYVPLHERVNADGFALLLPNGILDDEGNRFWNPTDGEFKNTEKSGKSGEDDVAYLTELVAEAKKIKDFGPVYFFGYSNGGFMSYHVACKGLPGLRAVASLAGTSYVEDSSCDGAPPRVHPAHPRHRGRGDPVRGRRKRA